MQNDHESVEVDLKYFVAGGHLCRATHLLARAQGGHPLHLERAAQLISFAKKLAPKDPAIIQMAAQIALERAKLQEARLLLEPMYRGRAPKEVIALFGFLLEAEGDVERARMTYLRLRALGEKKIAEQALERIKNYPALYQKPSNALFAYVENASPEDPATQLAFLRAAKKPDLLPEIAALALPYEEPAPIEVFALIAELKRKVIRGNLARLLATSLTLAEKEGMNVARQLAKSKIEDQAKAGGAALAKQGRGKEAAQILFDNQALSVDARAWALAFSPESAHPYLSRIIEEISGKNIRFLRGVCALLGGLSKEGANVLRQALQETEVQKAPEAIGWLLSTKEMLAKDFVETNLLRKNIPEWRRVGTEEIGRMGGEEWNDTLQNFVSNEPDPEVREEAVLALYALSFYNTKTTVQCIANLAKNDPDSKIRVLCGGLLTGKRFIRQRS